MVSYFEKTLLDRVSPGVFLKVVELVILGFGIWFLIKKGSKDKVS